MREAKQELHPPMTTAVAVPKVKVVFSPQKNGGENGNTCGALPLREEAGVSAGMNFCRSFVIYPLGIFGTVLLLFLAQFVILR